MSRIKRYFGQMRIRSKMYVLLISISVFLMLLFSISYSSIISGLHASMDKLGHQKLSLLKNEVTAQLNLMDKAAISIAVDPDVKAYIASDSGIADKELLKSRFTRLTAMEFDVAETNISSFMIVRSPDDYISAYVTSSLTRQEQATIASYVCEYAQTHSRLSYIPVPSPLADKLNAFFYVLPLSSGAYRTEGYMVVLVNSYFLSTIISRYYEPEQILFVSDANNNVIWSSNNPLVPPEELLQVTGHGTLPLSDDRKGITLLYNHMDDVGCYLSLLTPTDHLYAQVRIYQLVYAVSMILILGVSLLLVSGLSRSISSRLTDMASVIHSIRAGEIDTRYQVRYPDEIGLIGGELNRMMDQIQQLHLNVAQQALRKREAELHALQSRINPHFLYNSLDCIRATALVNSDTKAADQIQILANMFRYTVGGDGNWDKPITFDAEMNHLYDYLAMLGYRFEDRFRVDISVDPRILPLMTLKLTLQPIVENAFTHGIQKMLTGGQIRITATLLDDCVLWCVEDNGQGIHPQLLQKLQKRLQENPLLEKSEPFMGLCNINDRIRLAYGNNYGISLKSQPGQGTSVTIRYPILHQKTGGDASC